MPLIRLAGMGSPPILGRVAEGAECVFLEPNLWFGQRPGLRPLAAEGIPRIPS